MSSTPQGTRNDHLARLVWQNWQTRRTQVFGLRMEMEVTAGLDSNPLNCFFRPAPRPLRHRYTWLSDRAAEQYTLNIEEHELESKGEGRTRDRGSFTRL